MSKKQWIVVVVGTSFGIFGYLLSLCLIGRGTGFEIFLDLSICFLSSYWASIATSEFFKEKERLFIIDRLDSLSSDHKLVGSIFVDG